MSYGLRHYFKTRNNANQILIAEVHDAIRDVWDRWGVDGTEAVEHYKPFVENVTYDIVKEEMEK